MYVTKSGHGKNKNIEHSGWVPPEYTCRFADSRTKSINSLNKMYLD